MRSARVSVSVVLFAMGAGWLSGCRPAASPPPTPPAPPVTVIRPPLYRVQNYREYNGYLEAVETVEIKARVKGILQGVEFAEGEEVEKDTRLYTIDPREYRTAVLRAKAELGKAAADIDNWKAQTKLADVEFKRLDRLGGAVTRAEVDKAQATLAVTEAQLAVAEASREAAAAALQTATIQLGYTEIAAPISGRISRTLVTKGNLVGQDTPTLLTTIVSMDPLFVYFDAPERDLIEHQRLLQEAGQNPEVQRSRIEVRVATESGYPHVGKIDFQENKVDVNTGTVRLRGRVSNPPAEGSSARLLYPGLYAQVRIPMGAPADRPVIPEEALVTGQEGRFVYVLGPNNVAEKRSVLVGERIWQAPRAVIGGEVEWALMNPNPEPPAEGTPPPARRLAIQAVVAIEKGLGPDDQVVVNGLQRIRPGAPVAPVGWELKTPPAPAAPTAP